MKASELIVELAKCTMGAEVFIFTENGTKTLNIDHVDDGREQQTGAGMPIIALCAFSVNDDNTIEGK